MPTIKLSQNLSDNQDLVFLEYLGNFIVFPKKTQAEIDSLTGLVEGVFNTTIKNFQFYNGSFWQNGLDRKDFWDFSDTQYTQASPFAINANTEYFLPNNALSTTKLVGASADLYNPINQRLITNIENTRYQIAISFKLATPSPNGFAEIWLEEATAGFSKRRDSKLILKTNTINDLHFLLEYYASSSILNTGFRVKVLSNVACDIYQIDYTIFMV